MVENGDQLDCKDRSRQLSWGNPFLKKKFNRIGSKVIWQYCTTPQRSRENHAGPHTNILGPVGHIEKDKCSASVFPELIGAPQSS